MSELAQRSTTPRLGPGGPPSLLKRLQTDHNEVRRKKKPGPRLALLVTPRVDPGSTRLAPARGLTGLAMAAS